MKLTGKQKEQAEKTENIKDAGMELTDEEMDQVAGGGRLFDPEELFMFGEKFPIGGSTPSTDNGLRGFDMGIMAGLPASDFGGEFNRNPRLK